MRGVSYLSYETHYNQLVISMNLVDQEARDGVTYTTAANIKAARTKCFAIQTVYDMFKRILLR